MKAQLAAMQQQQQNSLRRQRRPSGGGAKKEVNTQTANGGGGSSGLHETDLDAVAPAAEPLKSALKQGRNSIDKGQSPGHFVVRVFLSNKTE